MRGLVIDDPPRGVVVGGLRRGPCAKDTINLHGAQTARNHSRPARLARSIRVRSENPLRLRVSGGAENHLERLCGNAIGLAGVDAEDAEVCGDARLHADERLTSDFTCFRGEKLCEMLKQLVYGFTQRSRQQAALMALIKAARADGRLIGCGWDFGRCGPVARRQAAKRCRRRRECIRRRRHSEHVLCRGCEGIDGPRFVSLCGLSRLIGAPGLETALHLFAQTGPRSGQQTARWWNQSEGLIVRRFELRACEQMQFFAGARGGHIEQPAGLLRLAFATGLIDQRLCRTAFRALRLERRHKKFGNGAGAVFVDCVSLRRQTALQPGKQFPAAAARIGLQIRHDRDLKFKPLRLVDSHQLHAAVAAGGGIRQRVEFCEGRIECGAEKILLSLRQIVETTPKEIEIGARSRVHTTRSAQTQPDLLEPGSR